MNHLSIPRVTPGLLVPSHLTQTFCKGSYSHDFWFVTVGTGAVGEPELLTNNFSNQTTPL